MSHGMPLDLLSPARHAATEIERVAPAALSVSDIAETYHHPNTGDVSRVRVRAGVQAEHDVNCWLIEEALKKLQHRGATVRSAAQIVNDDGKWQFADGVTFDDLEWDGRKMHRVVNHHQVLKDPFDKMTGGFSENIRAVGNLDELRESMKEFGWVDDPIFYALADEHGVVLVGHRRIAVAQELDIKPRIRTVQCGVGDEADLTRLKLALVSNIGQRNMTPGERQKIVKVLAGPDHDWKQMSIAAALGVSQYTIHKDIEALKERTELLVTNNPVQADWVPEARDRHAKGESIADIARALNRPPSTVRDHLTGRYGSQSPGRPPKETKTTDPALHTVIDQEWERRGKKPSTPEIVVAAKQVGIDIGQTTAKTALAIVQAKHEAIRPEPEPEPEPVVESPPHEHRYVMRYICECGKEQT